MRFPSPGRFKDSGAFRAHWRALTGDLDCVEEPRGSAGALARPIEVFGRKLANRFAIHPMEGWDGTTDGRPSEATLRRWRRFGESGAQLIWGGEAWAVSPEARANPNQLCTTSESAALESLAQLREAVREGARSQGDDPERLVIGLQMTHSGRWARPTSAGPTPLAACADRVLDARFAAGQVHVLSDDELATVIERYVALARLAQRAGFDFVDVKACHGYLIHELLGARERPGAVGGTLKHRARVLLRIVERIREACPALGIGVRMSVGDVAPHRRDAHSGIGRAESDAAPRGFGSELSDGGAFELAEPLQVIDWLAQLGVGAISVTLGSPYTCPHVQRPAAYPPSDGYEPPRDPLLEVARHLRATREIKRAFPSCVIVGAGYTYLQEWLPHVAEHELERGHVDLVGLGRMVLSYPTLPRDALGSRTLERRALCRTFSDCTTAPRNGLPSGCYPLDPHYRNSPDAERLAQVKKLGAVRGDSTGGPLRDVEPALHASVSIAGRELALRDDVLAKEQRAAPTLPRVEPVRLAFAALHVVLRDGASTAPGPGLEDALDWPATLALRTRFDALGFGIGEAMDTAQRFSIGWPVARRLIEECGRLRPKHGFIAGAAADQLARVERRSQLVDAVVEQARLIQSCGGWPILLPQTWLVESRASEDAYVEFYRDVLGALDGPLFVHWLGEMFHAGLRGYFPGRSFERVMALDPAKVRGAKLSLLDRELELRVRRELLARDQIVLTGDDFNFSALIVGDAEQQGPARWTEIGGRRVALGRFSHALLGVLDGCAVPASIALDRLARGYAWRAHELLARCERLGRAVFEPPTQHYKAGLALISWLNGWQDVFALVADEHKTRDLDHYARVAALASEAGALVDSKLAADRLAQLPSLLA